MNQLEMILNSFGSEIGGLKMQLEILNNENRANMISSAVLDLMNRFSGDIDMGEGENGEVGVPGKVSSGIQLCALNGMVIEPISEFFDTEVRKRIDTLITSFESISEVVPPDLVEDEEINKLYDAIVRAEIEHLVCLCHIRLGVYCNSGDYLLKVKELLNETVANLLQSQQELSHVIFHRLSEANQKKIITPTKPDGGIIKLDDFIKK